MFSHLPFLQYEGSWHSFTSAKGTTDTGYSMNICLGPALVDRWWTLEQFNAIWYNSPAINTLCKVYSNNFSPETISETSIELYC